MQKKVDFDINNLEFNKNGLENFTWPIDIFSIDNFRDSILKDLIPFLKNNKNLDEDESIKKPLNILFKWFILDILNIFKACQIKVVFEQQKLNISCPKRFVLLNDILQNKCPSNIFDTLKSGPTEKFQKIKILKKIFRFFQINSIRDILKLNFSRTCVLNYSVEISNFCKNNGEINSFKNYSDYFKFHSKNLSKISYKDLNKKNKSILLKLISILKKNFIDRNVPFTDNVSQHFINFIIQADFFIRFYKKQIKYLPKKIIIGSPGSQVWTKMLSNFVLNNGGDVIGVEHGRGDILHDFLPKNFVEFDDISKFICLNKKHADINRKRLKKYKSLHLSDRICAISYLNKKIKNPFKLNKLENSVHEIKNRKKIGLYISTAYMGYGARLRPILPDIIYYDFQIRLISDLIKLNNIILCRPHPEGRSKVNEIFFDKLKCKKVYENYDKAIKKHKFDFFITDHIASTTMVDMILSNKPTILMNFNTPKIDLELKEDLYNSIEILDVSFDKNNRTYYDLMELKRLLEDIDKKNKHPKSINKYYK